MSCEVKVHLTCNGCGKEAQSGQGWFAIDENWGSLFVLELTRWSLASADPDREPLLHACSKRCALELVRRFLDRYPDPANSGAPDGAPRHQPKASRGKPR